MDYTGKNLRSVGGYMNHYLFFNDDICYKFLDMSAQDLEVDIDKQPQFEDLSCDLVDGDVMICANNEKQFLKLLQYIADSYKGSVKAFFRACNVERRFIDKVDFINESAKMTKKEQHLLEDKIERWKEELHDFLFANWDWIEYCAAEREVWIEGVVCNYIKFPKAENGRNANKVNLQEIIDTIWESDLRKKFYGPDSSYPNVIEFGNSLYIVWNAVESEDWQYYDADYINKMFRY